MKKGRVMVRRAPNQQSFGNCDSWTIIVGKKSKKHSRKNLVGAKLLQGNKNTCTAYPQA
jgi:hypothetical protein